MREPMNAPMNALGGASYDGLVRIEERPVQGMITLRGDLSSVAVKNAVTGVSGVDMPGQRQVAVVDGRGAAWMSPDELMIFVPYADADTAVATMTQHLSEEHSLVVNVSDARAMFRLSGAGVREVVAKLVPVDMAKDAFGPGQIRRTRFAQVAGAFWMVDDETVDVICFRSVAEYMFNLLKTAAAPGSAVRYL